MLRSFMSSSMRRRSGVIVWVIGNLLWIGLPKPGDPDRRRRLVYGLKYSARGGKGRESNLVRPFKDGSVEPFPWFVAFEELSSGGSKCRAFQLDLVPDRDAVVADRRDRRLECPASLDSTGPQLGQVK